MRALLPEEPALDLALNLMTFDPGASLPFVETHVMEHGLLVLEGSLVYRLAERLVPGRPPATRSGWAPSAPSGAAPTATGPATYLIYKDWNRDVMA